MEWMRVRAQRGREGYEIRATPALPRPIVPVISNASPAKRAAFERGGAMEWMRVRAQRGREGYEIRADDERPRLIMY
jgi:hypothetical protein